MIADAIRVRSPRRRGSAARLTLGLLAWLFAVVFVAPLVWILLTSFHGESDAVGNPPKFAAPLTLDNYADLFTGGASSSLWSAIGNSVVASLGSTLLVLILAVPAAYALSIRPVRKWRNVMMFFLSTRMLPVVGGLLPIYLIARNVGLLDNILVLVILYAGMNLPIAIWMMRSFLQEVPVAVLEAAAIDGAPLRSILWRVVLPLTAPGIAATSLICFIFSWQEFLLARSLTALRAGTAPIFLSSMVSAQGGFVAHLAAAAMIISLPVLIAGIAAQDRLVQGLSLGAVK
ncbi:carbohydrate ABC transporter permease [Microbacterium sp. RD1]|uniref:carbohydrate ABC transporter permease n=1 Tax=Microbacterium sp. RD1 TaxID=3457313 RepID=UPI003FA612A6